jgi:hypothetical protein
LRVDLGSAAERLARLVYSRAVDRGREIIFPERGEIVGGTGGLERPDLK